MHSETQISIPVHTPKSTPIAGSYCYTVDHGMVHYFIGLDPYFCHPLNDIRSRNLCIARLNRTGRIRIADLARAFNMSRDNVNRILRQWDQQGDAGFFLPYPTPKPRKRTVFTPELVSQAEALLTSGKSGRQCAAELGIATSTFNINLRAGVIKTKQQPTPEASERSQREDSDRHTAMGRACHDVPRRQLAACGMMDEATPQFDRPALAVARGGVLAALPMLLDEGLLEETHHLPELPKGYCGNTSILLTVALMTLARVRNPETLRYHSPGEWGQLLGLDRCPEVKTLRQKVALLASGEQQVRAWQSALSAKWLAGMDEAAATLAVDGHVKVYSGRKGNLPSHFISRQKLCLPAAASYWINALDGQPLVCLHQQLDPKMVQALEQDIVPHLRALGIVPDNPPDLRNLRAGEPAVTLVFDREGWSPGLFERLAASGVACITWHKNFKGEDWPRSMFKECEVPRHAPAQSRTDTAWLAEQRICLSNGLLVRQIRRLTEQGRQMPLVTTHPSMPMTQVAGSMFSRWCQENYFKVARREYNLDAMPEHALVPLDPDTQVVNPTRRTVQKTIRNAQRRLHNRQVKTLGQAEPDPTLSGEIQDLETQLQALKLQRQDLPTHVRAGDLSPDESLHALPLGKRLFYDVIRMLCYRAETRMMAALCEAQPSDQTGGRKPLAALMQTEANIVPDLERGILQVQFLGLANDATERMLQPLVDQLNQTETVYPGTDLKLVYQFGSDDSGVKCTQ